MLYSGLYKLSETKFDQPILKFVLLSLITNILFSMRRIAELKVLGIIKL